MNVVVIEDEKPAARRLVRMLSPYEVNVVTSLHSVQESVDWFKNNTHPELIFLDIQLSDGLSFEIFEQIELKSAIIFTTAYDEYALQAFKLNSVDYLLKPIDNDELKSAIAKYRETRKTPLNAPFDLEKIRSLLGVTDTNRYKKRYTVKIGQHLKIIEIEKVSCIYSLNKGTYAVTEEGREYLLETTLEMLEADLNPDKFFRVSRKFYVNIDFINDIVAYSNSRLKIVVKGFNGPEIIVSREKVKDFKYWIQ